MRRKLLSSWSASIMNSSTKNSLNCTNNLFSTFLKNECTASRGNNTFIRSSAGTGCCCCRRYSRKKVLSSDVDVSVHTKSYISEIVVEQHGAKFNRKNKQEKLVQSSQELVRALDIDTQLKKLYCNDVLPFEAITMLHHLSEEVKQQLVLTSITEPTAKLSEKLVLSDHPLTLVATFKKLALFWILSRSSFCIATKKDFQFLMTTPTTSSECDKASQWSYFDDIITIEETIHAWYEMIAFEMEKRGSLRARIVEGLNKIIASQFSEKAERNDDTKKQHPYVTHLKSIDGYDRFWERFNPSVQPHVWMEQVLSGELSLKSFLKEMDKGYLHEMCRFFGITIALKDGSQGERIRVISEFLQKVISINRSDLSYKEQEEQARDEMINHGVFWTLLKPVENLHVKENVSKLKERHPKVFRLLFVMYKHRDMKDHTIYKSLLKTKNSEKFDELLKKAEQLSSQNMEVEQDVFALEFANNSEKVLKQVLTCYCQNMAKTYGPKERAENDFENIAVQEAFLRLQPLDFCGFPLLNCFMRITNCGSLAILIRSESSYVWDDSLKQLTKLARDHIVPHCLSNDFRVGNCALIRPLVNSHKSWYPSQFVKECGTQKVKQDQILQQFRRVWQMIMEGDIKQVPGILKKKDSEALRYILDQIPLFLPNKSSN
ncbi:hypothetical protein C9374_008576 [Naegleria lovaniensis]|uniref:Uncharacterized protein n=1 Tax=Naegleria lovaniensis TaxID=51637 RepID=A0AA88KKL9_NAELO|nr:uncharacterized protein C9374_008576 [Naegleria lovaniensis]KAG2377954.1 hypothetical protein C9374_008576 [Naegleria lovaniensis]